MHWPKGRIVTYSVVTKSVAVTPVTATDCGPVAVRSLTLQLTGLNQLCKVCYTCGDPSNFGALVAFVFFCIGQYKFYT